VTLHVSRFARASDKDPRQVDISWEQLAEALTEVRIRANPDGELWCPGRFLEGSVRNADNVLDMWCLVLDFDDGLLPEDARAPWDEMGLEYVIHSTWHHKREKVTPSGKVKPAVPRWRAVFPLTMPVAGHRWSAIYRRLAEYLASKSWDANCTDPCRMYYLPAAEDDSLFFGEWVRGRKLDAKEAPKLPEEEKPKAPRPRIDLPEDYNRLLDALSHVPSDDYEVWIKCGMALHLALGEGGKDTWDEWSQTSEAYDAEVMDKKWASFSTDRDRSVGTGTIYRYAMQNGWVPPLQSVEEDDPKPDGWRTGLTMKPLNDGSLVIEKTPGNLALLLAHEKQWSRCIRHNQLSYTVVWDDMAPFVPGMSAPSGELADEHLVYVQQAARRQWGVTWSIDAVHKALHAAAPEHSFHPVKDYLEGIKWDGKPRLTNWLMDYHGGEPSEIPTGRWWAISAVARAYRAGCQVDHVLVLQGPQGCGKSTALRILGGDWYSDSLDSLNDKDSYQSLLGKWIVEIAELDALKGKASTEIKKFISKVVDSYRPSYGRCTVNRPRQCVFAGTTNEHEYLQDASGARRFWPVTVGQLNHGALKRDRDQLWAEATAAYKSGERFWPQGQTEAEALAEEVEARFSVDPWEEAVEEWLLGKDKVSMQQVMDAVGVESGRAKPYDTRRLGAILRRLHWKNTRTNRGRFWVKSDGGNG